MEDLLTLPLPDGRKISFPKGMSVEDMNAATVKFLEDNPLPQEKGMFEKAGDWITGANADPNIPSALTAGLGLEPRQSAKMTGLLATTISDERMMKGISEIIPQAQFDKDQNGNLVAVVNGKRFYPNRPGFDITDMLIASGVVTAAQAVAKGSKTVGLPYQGVLGGTLTGATEAGLVEAINSKLTNEPYKWSDIPYGAAGGGVGAKAGQIIGGLVDAFKRTGIETVLTASGDLTPAAKKMAIDAGLDPDQIRAEVAAAIKAEIQRGATPRAAGITAQSQILPTPVPMSAGQISGSEGQQLFEDVARKGGYGNMAAATMRGFKDQQQEALSKNLDQILIRMSGTGSALAKGEGGTLAQGSLVAQRDAAKASADLAYKAARSTNAFVPPEYGDELSTALRQKFSEGFSERTSPTVSGMLDDFGTIVESGDVKAMMDWRAQVTNLRGSPTVDAKAAGDILDVFDQKMLEMGDKAILYGDEIAVKNWYEAISKYSDFKKTWDSKGGILSTLTNEVMKDGSLVLKVSPEAAGNAIFGASSSGMATKMELPRTLLTLQSKLAKPEWDALRQEAFLRIMAPAQKIGLGGQDAVSGIDFLKSWTNLRKSNPGVIRTLFTKEEQGLINDFAATAARVTGVTVNSSNTAAAMSGIIQRMAVAFGSTKIAKFLTELPGLALATRGVGLARTAGAISPPPPSMPFATPSYGVGAGVGVSQQEPIRQDLTQRSRGFLGFGPQ
jgi:hypothetical protein